MIRVRAMATAVTALMIVAQAATAGEVAERFAVIFAPSKYEHLEDGVSQSNGAARLHKRLLDAGYEAGNITLLSGDAQDATGQATAATLDATLKTLAADHDESDTLLVVVATYAISSGGVDYVCDQTTTPEQIASLANEDSEVSDSLIPVSRIANWMSRSNAAQCLVIDGGAEESGLEASRTAGFGQAIAPAANQQFIMLSRSGRLQSPESDETLSVFMQSVVDGLSRHADISRDSSVSLLEFVDYVTLFAEVERVAAPRLAGKTNSDVLLTTVNPDADDDELDLKFRQKLATGLLDSARKALLVERNVAGARTALTRAAEYGLTGPVQDEITRLLLTLKVHDGGFNEAWAESTRRELPLIVYAPRTINIMGGEEKLGEFTPGQFGLISKTFGDNAWARLDTVYVPVIESGVLTFRTSTTEGWIESSRLSGDADEKSDSAEDALRLIDALKGAD